MIFDVPAEKGGALTILNQYYSAALNENKNNYIFVLGIAKLSQTQNIKVLNYRWVKKSWLHRLYFDYIVAKRIVQKYEPDDILSLQNVLIPRVRNKQTLYLHQSLPFSEKRYRIYENFKFWLYQNIVIIIIKKSIQKADKVIVQTKWIRDAAMRLTNTNENRYTIIQPQINIEIKKMYKLNDASINMFFYPAAPLIYKNHIIIIKACMFLKKQGFDNFKIFFTLKGDENKYIQRLKKIVVKENLPIEFIGVIEIKNVYEFYTKSTLIFPSYLESFGLPLLEARLHNCPIISSDCDFAREILEGYNDVDYFNPNDHFKLSNLIISKITNELLE